ncbi:unnamed protein product [Sphagnum jensenii]|uniref:Uncharacterized protein n=1 Tax=Sphagnum jensenii TaxID=128206 RepID=A0ABP1A7U3_9BRYO
MGREGCPGESQSKMGDAGPANDLRGFGHHRPQDSIGSPPCKTIHKRSHTWRGTMEGVGAAQGRPNQTARPWERPLQHEPKLAPRRPKTKETSKLNVGKHCKRLAQRKTRALEVGPILHRRNSKTANLRKPVNPKRKRPPPGSERSK